MIDSILDSVKDSVGVESNTDAFDGELLIHINSAFMSLNQLGVGPDEVFHISDNTSKWTDFMQDIDAYPMVKSYMFVFVKLLFDPPTSSFVLEALKESKAEYEWRLNVQADDTWKEE